MKNTEKYRFGDRVRSFRFAFKGLYHLVRYEHNFRIHLAAFVIVITAGLLFGISVSEWLAVLFVSSLVLIAEAINSALESLADSITVEENEKIRESKDVAAAAVLISAIVAVVTGIVIFLPYIVNTFS